MIKFPSHKPYFINILSDEDGNIYVIKLKDPSGVKHGVDIDYFNSKGEYLYRFTIKNKMPAVIRREYFYTVETDSETDYFRIKRYKIKNWEQIKKNEKSNGWTYPISNIHLFLL